MGVGGPAGTNGTAGATGPAGATGTQGPTGNANVVYTDWATPEWGSFVNESDRITLIQKSNTNALLTKDVIDKAAIYFYVKVMVLTNDGKIVERIRPSYGVYEYNVPGRAANASTGQGFIYVDPEINVNFLRIDGILFKERVPELTGKTLAYYADLAKDAKYRMVIVNGSTKGRLAAVDMNDYAAVKKAFNLKD